MPWTFAPFPLTSDNESLTLARGYRVLSEVLRHPESSSSYDLQRPCAHDMTPNIPTAKETTVPTTEAERTTKNGKSHGTAEGLVEGIAESFEGLATIARTQAEDSFKQGEMAGLVLKDESIASIKAAEGIVLSVLSAMADITAPFTPKLPSVVPVSNLERC